MRESHALGKSIWNKTTMLLVIITTALFNASEPSLKCQLILLKLEQKHYHFNRPTKIC